MSGLRSLQHPATLSKVEARSPSLAGFEKRYLSVEV
jgi:hypothetical protein